MCDLTPRTKALFVNDAASRQDLDSRRRDFEVTRARVATAEKAFDDATLRAPFAGTVAKKLVQDFANVQAKEAVVVLQDDSSLEVVISVPEQGGDKLIPDGPLNPGVLHTVATGVGGHLGLYRLETQTTAGNGKLNLSGLGSSGPAKEAVKVAFTS